MVYPLRFNLGERTRAFTGIGPRKSHGTAAQSGFHQADSQYSRPIMIITIFRIITTSCNHSHKANETNKTGFTSPSVTVPPTALQWARTRWHKMDPGQIGTLDGPRTSTGCRYHRHG